MSVTEFQSWIEYREMTGPFNPMLRMDAAFARLSVLIAALTGNKRNVSDFMPFIKAKSDAPASVEDITKLIG